MTGSPLFVLTTRFDAPPAYAAAWLTDYREDDGRFFGEAATYRVRREGARIHREQISDLGPARQVVTLETPTRWSAVNEILDEKGHVVLVLRAVETVRPDGAGTHHEAQIFAEGRTDEMRAMVPAMAPEMKAGLQRGFAAMKAEMDAQFRAGKPPTA